MSLSLLETSFVCSMFLYTKAQTNNTDEDQIEVNSFHGHCCSAQHRFQFRLKLHYQIRPTISEVTRVENCTSKYC